MDLAAVVAQLKAYTPNFGGRVAGAADFATGLRTQVWQDLPAAYVIPLEDEAAPNDEMNGLRQVVTERIGVIVEFDNSVDRRGQGATLNYDAMRSAIWKAILNWHVDPVRAARGLEFAGGRLLEFDTARLFFQWEFTLEIQIDDTDGFQIDSVPLLEIDMNTRPGDPPFPAKAILPQ